MKEAIKLGIFSTFGGLMLSAVGVIMLLFQDGITGALLALPIAIISIGGIFAISGLIMLVGRFIAQKGSSAFAKEVKNGDKEIEILANDERNIAIDRRVSHSQIHLTGWLDSAVLIFLMVMQVELVVTLVVFAVLMAKIIVRLFLHFKYSKEM